MSESSEITSLVERLQQELRLIDREANAGINLAREFLDCFPENARFIQIFAVFNSAILFAETQRRRIQSIVENLSAINTVTKEEFQEAGEDLSAELGRILETKMRVSNLKNRLESLR